ncbi:DUF6431 domain-containing protein [Alicyclobacillus cycloheptanicus]|uniref:DUF6431 domain-containing protein n=1 Tax=Alicyclobacillus cycloheptanicus TaxID=1457 RepID=UPI003899254C
MPIVCVDCESVNADEYANLVHRLLPQDIPCIYCGHLCTYVHAYYLRRPFDLDEQRHHLWIQRRQCPSCQRTFALLPSFVAPFQRYTLVIQDLLSSLLSGRATLEFALSTLAELGVSLSESSARAWFSRVSAQVPDILARFSSFVQRHLPDAHLPRLRTHVRDVRVCAYYDRLRLLGDDGHSGVWNRLRQVVYLFAPSVSVNRVSYGLSPEDSS